MVSRPKELFREFEGGKNQVGSDALVGISVKGGKNHSVVTFFGTFSGERLCFRIFLVSG